MSAPRRLRGAFGICNLREGFVNLHEGFVEAPWRLREGWLIRQIMTSPLRKCCSLSQRSIGAVNSFSPYFCSVRSVSISGKGEKLDPSRGGVVEENVAGDLDGSSESIGVRSSVTASLVSPTPTAVPCGRVTPVGR